MREIAALTVDPSRAIVYEHGWQSWSPTRYYRLGQPPLRPPSPERLLMTYRPGRPAAPDVYRGEGLLAVDPGNGDDVQVFAAPAADGEIASIEARLRGDEVVVSADGDVQRATGPATGGVYGALAGWATGFAAASGVAALRPAPTMWCSWYRYFDTVTEADVDENLLALDELDLDVDVVQIDDGYQAEIGDWLRPSDRFGSLRGVVARIRDRGRRAGIWLAPFLASPRSELAVRHPYWLMNGVSGGVNWGQQQRVVDLTHPGAERYLRAVLGEFVAMGVDFFKIDFLYAGALDGPRAQDSASGVLAYRHGLRMIRDAIGPDSYLLGCGAPMLPSVGLVDAMRIGPDIARHLDPHQGDAGQPSQRSAAVNASSRAWQHGRFWINDADCLLATPDMQGREDWANYVERYSGLRASGDRLRDLDGWGLATTRRLLMAVPPQPFQLDGRPT